MSANNVVTIIMIGEAYRRMGELTIPTIRRYAEKIGAEFQIIDTPKVKKHPYWEKLQIRDLANAH